MGDDAGDRDRHVALLRRKFEGDEFILTSHFRERMDERNISVDDIKDAGRRGILLEVHPPTGDCW